MLEKMGSYPIWFTGSARTYWRVVYKTGGNYFCKWYGNFIELKRGFSGYFETIEQY